MSAAHEMSVERFIAAPPEHVWRCWTERLDDWYCPRPWQARKRKMELRAGGRFATDMHGPDGEQHGGEGVFLEVVPNRRLVFTTVTDGDWVPQEGMQMIGIWEFDPRDGGTLLRGTARHWDAATAQQHRDMGFEAGWGAAMAQLAEIAEAG